MGLKTSKFTSFVQVITSLINSSVQSSIGGKYSCTIIVKKNDLLPIAITRYSSALELKNYLSWSPVTEDT